jgi:hypothetical protein
MAAEDVAGILASAFGEVEAWEKRVRQENGGWIKLSCQSGALKS